jgi:glycosyltransferase involved in cell wall biosynthesis
MLSVYSVFSEFPDQSLIGNPNSSGILSDSTRRYLVIRFSVLIPAYNRQKYIRQVIDSVLAQTFPSFEVIAIDDGSTDDTMEILKSYGDRIRLIEQLNQGPEVARNTGAASARGEYLALLDSDDLLFPHALSTYDRIIRAFDSPALVVGANVEFEDGETVSAPNLGDGSIEVYPFKDFLSRTVPIAPLCSNMVVRKSVFREVGGHRNSTPQTWHNDDLWFRLKMGTYGPCIVAKSPPVVAYRFHGGQSISQVQLITEGILRIIDDEYRGVFPGGNKRRFARYSQIGGRALDWGRKRALKGGRLRQGLWLLFKGSPMIAAGLGRSFLRRFQKPASVITLDGSIRKPAAEVPLYEA